MQTFSKSLELATNLAKNLPIAPTKFNSDTTKDYFTDIFDNKRNKFQLFNISAAYVVIKKNLSSLHVYKTC